MKVTSTWQLVENATEEIQIRKLKSLREGVMDRIEEALDEIRSIDMLIDSIQNKPAPAPQKKARAKRS